MAYVNVVDWKTEQVCEWLKGLDNSVLPYVHSFTNNKVNGQQLLGLRPEDLEQLGVFRLGHQEIILEAVEYLRNFHYELDRENLQLLALRLSCQAHSLHNELCRQTDSEPVPTQTLSDVVGVMAALKPLARWLDRPPFSGQLEYNDKKNRLLELSIEMATCAQRDRFAEDPIDQIRNTCGKLAALADYIIQDESDPMILQPSSLDLATLKKRPGDDLGFYILPSFHGSHQIAEIKFGSAAHQCGKMEEGDEIVQINYQTIVGWEKKNVLELFNESPVEVLLTLKRRPRHTKVYGQIYIKPYRLPSNKKISYTTRWQHNLPSPRPELLTIPDFTMPLPRHAPKDPTPEPISINSASILDTMTTDSSGESDSDIETCLERLNAQKPRNLVQRRATITGASPTTKHAVNIEQFWRELKQERSTTFQLRDKAASCAHGLDSVPANLRPQTCLGIEQSKRKKKVGDATERKVQFNDKLRSIETSPTAEQISADVQSNNSDTAVPLSDCVEPSSGIGPCEGVEMNLDCDTPANHACFAQIVIDSRSASITPRITIDKTDSYVEKNRTDNIFDLKCLNIMDQVENSTVEQSSIISDNGNNISSNNNEIKLENLPSLKHETGENVLPDDSTYSNSSEKLNNNDLMCTNDIFDNNNIEFIESRLKNSDICHESSRESSQEKSESTSSYMEGIYSSSSEAETPVKFRPIPSPTKADSPMDLKAQTSLRRPPGAQTPADEPARVISSPERKPEVKSRQTPPEPPPRKYFTKPPPLNLTTTILPEVPDRPRVPERPETRRLSAGRHEIYEKRSNSDFSLSRDCFEGYRDFVEKSMDFIDEPGRLTEHSEYSQISEWQGKDEKAAMERYELFMDKFGSVNSVNPGAPELPYRATDSPDGAGCSRPTPELRIRTLEKDKHYERGVVNRAMMVARSIGLHSSSKVSVSPRSSRKRNVLLAKRRNVSVRDIGPGDLEGWLTYRSRGAGGAWARAWFVLKGSSLYRFKNLDSIKSDCLIMLPGFTASQAAEVKSRKHAFKVYHTGTVFYFAAETEDCLSLWLDSINKATLGADSQNRTSGLFSETDESDSEGKTKGKGSVDVKGSAEKSFGSLKKLGRKDSANKDHETGGASLDRKYLRFLGARTQNVPVPTAQFRSYRRVLPSSTPNRKPELVNNSPDMQVTVAGSTFYDLSSSHSVPDVPNNTSPEMDDYRQPTERPQHRNRRPDDLRGFVTLEEFMLSQNETRQRAMSSTSASPRITPLPSDQSRYFDDNSSASGQSSSFSNGSVSNGMIYGHPRNGEDSPVPLSTSRYNYSRQFDGRSMSEHQVDMIYGQRYENRHDEYNQRSLVRRNDAVSFSHGRRMQEGAVYYPPKQKDTNCRQNSIGKPSPRPLPQTADFPRDGGLLSRIHCRSSSSGNDVKDRLLREVNRADSSVPQPLPRRFVKDSSYSGSSGDLRCYSPSETLQRAKKEASVSRKGSFNLNDRCRDVDKHWIDSLRRSADRKASEKLRLKNAAQYQPPPKLSSPFEANGMRAAFEMHLDKGEQVQKTSRFKSLFGGKSLQKPDFAKEPQKTLLGSPRLHRALFRDKNAARVNGGKSGTQGSGDSGFSQSLSSYADVSQAHTLSQSFSSVSSVGDWSPERTVKPGSECSVGFHLGSRRSGKNSSIPPPTLPYIPPPTSPPPDDYPGLEYPPVFEPGTYSLSDASLLRTRSRKNGNDSEA